jgi:hypothetical protein
MRAPTCDGIGPHPDDEDAIASNARTRIVDHDRTGQLRSIPVRKSMKRRVVVPQ